MTSNQDMNRNPTGKGGFKDNPQNRNNGTWNSEDSISFQYKKLIRMPVNDFKNWLQDYPEKDRTVAQELAYNAVVKARKDLKYLIELTNRTEGTSKQSIDVNGDLSVTTLLSKLTGENIQDEDNTQQPTRDN
jgi:hypothetical protein